MILYDVSRTTETVGVQEKVFQTVKQQDVNLVCHQRNYLGSLSAGIESKQFFCLIFLRAQNEDKIVSKVFCSNPR